MRNIDEMKTWEIIDYIRENRKYQIIEGGTKELIEAMFQTKLNDEEWSQFSNQVERRQDVLYEYIKSMYDGIFSYQNQWRFFVESK